MLGQTDGKANMYEWLQGSTIPADVNDHEDGTVIHVVPDASKSRWNHIEDLDSFFTRVYTYHRRHGFFCILSQELLDLLQFLFVIFFSVYILQCVDYPILFSDKGVNGTAIGAKVRLDDALIPVSKCLVSLSPALTGCIVVSALFWTFRLVRFIYHIICYWEIRNFYQFVLNIRENDLDNFTWNEVQAKLRQAQRDHLMCIHKPDLTDLDIHHRILRFTNYFVAMVNKQILPIKFNLPIIGDAVFLTKGLKYNLDLVLFWGPGAPFDSSWHLREEFKRTSRRQELAERLSHRMRTFGLINLILAPLVVIWQLLHSVFRYAEEVKRDPSLLGVRKWSLYGRYYVRHFNELDHDLDSRLSRAYTFASKYMTAFSSPAMAIAARHLQFMCGSVLFVLICLTVWDEDVLTVEHMVTLMAGLGAVVGVCSAFIPDENVVFFHADLLAGVLAHVHYLPSFWIEQAHMAKVRSAFAQLFQLKAAFLIEELLSPIMTPVILLVWLPKASLRIVDFLGNHTIDVIGVGDVCSFAQLDIGRHGDPTCKSFVSSAAPDGNRDGVTGKKKSEKESPAEECKTELSLVHFALTNPDWKPPEASNTFLESLHQKMRVEASEPVLNSQSQDSLRSLLAGVQPTWGRSFLASDAHSMSPISGYQSFMQPPLLNVARLSNRPGRIEESRAEPTLSTVEENFGQSVLLRGPDAAAARELNHVMEMARSALFIHSVRQRQSYRGEQHPREIGVRESSEEQEMTPLLRLNHSA